jgi:AmmeMemoRadiSam system protein A
MNPYIQLAQKAIEKFVKTGEIISPPKNLAKKMLKDRAGVFVSLHNKKDGSLRGCIGTFLPTQENMAKEIISNAISAAANDPRFAPVKSGELKNLKISVDILSNPEQAKNLDELDVKKYGIIVRALDLRRTGLLLPDIEGVNSVEEQIAIACRKAGIDPKKDKILLYKFTVKRHE